MWIYLLLFCSCVSAASAESRGVVAHRGEQIEIRCSYGHGYESNVKYFCKGRCTFGVKNNIVKSGSRSKNERFSLRDDTRKRAFSVTITDLRAEDAGQYWCGVERKFQRDEYSEIWLRVDDDKRRTEVSTARTGLIPHADVSSAPVAQIEPPQPVLNGKLALLVSGGVLIVLLAAALILALTVRRKKQVQAAVLVCRPDIFDLSCRSAHENKTNVTLMKPPPQNHYEKMNPVLPSNSPRAPSSSPPRGAGGSDVCCAEAVPAETLDEEQTYTELNASAWTHHRPSEEEAVYHSI